MAIFERDDVRLHYTDSDTDTDTDTGFPVLLIAPGGMRSTMDKWAAMPWNPLEALTGSYRIIAMDQRNAGGSTAPITADDGWGTYTADQLALLDHLGVERCHVIGMCIGGPYSLALAMAAPDRIASAVLLQPIGIDDNRQAFVEMFDGWAAEVGPDHPEADADAFASFRENMYGGDFVFVATPEEVAAVETPLLVAMGDDLYHPQSTSREIARLAPEATLIERWKDDDVAADTDQAIKAFLAAHTPN
jgi:pimeloyl-ACP methyl ester carboxylesterase